MDAIAKYKELWESKQITKPLVILLGGYAGTGKSTLAAKLNDLIGHMNVLPTGVVRAAIRDYITEADNPYLYTHTYKLDKLGDQSLPIKERVINNFEAQCAPITKAINKVVEFAQTEKQHYIIDGNHVLAGEMVSSDSAFVIEMYLTVSKPKLHKVMIGGPTHNRSLTKSQFANARLITDYINEKAVRHNKPLFEFDQAYEGAVELINSTLKEYFNETSIQSVSSSNHRTQRQSVIA